MSYDKYERGRQHLNGGHQRIAYKKKLVNTYPTANKSNQWVGVDHATQIHLLSTSPMTSSADENKMEVMMTLTI